MAKMYFKEIVPPHDVLQDELENIKGGMNESGCSQGCSTGCTTGNDENTPPPSE